MSETRRYRVTVTTVREVEVELGATILLLNPAPQKIACALATSETVRAGLFPHGQISRAMRERETVTVQEISE